MKQHKKTNLINGLLWAIYIALLIVLLPHLKWMAQQFEPDTSDPVAWAFAVAFELVIAAFTHKLRERIEAMPRSIKAKGRVAVFVYQWLNPISLGLVFFVGVSALGNFTHAYEFGSAASVRTFTFIPFGVYSVAFGGALPLANLLFAHVLSESSITEDEPNPELDQAKLANAELRKQNKQLNELFDETKAKLRQTEIDFVNFQNEANVIRHKLQTAESNFSTEKHNRTQIEEQLNKLSNKFGELSALMSESKRDRIIAVNKLWSDLPQSSIAIISGAATSTVSEVLKSIQVSEVTA